MMKTHFTAPTLLASVLLSLIATATDPVAGADSNASLAMRDPVKHEELSQKLRIARQQDPISGLGPAVGKADVDPSLTQSKRDLVKDSAILCFRGSLTLVPKQAVLFLPELLKDRFKEHPNVKVVPWADFFQANRGWIRTVEVSREQAMGQAPMSKENVSAYQNGSSAVIATFKGGPISVLPYQEKTEAQGSDAAITSPVKKQP